MCKENFSDRNLVDTVPASFISLAAKSRRKLAKARLRSVLPNGHATGSTRRGCAAPE
jgi:hypothetical protein